MATDAASTPAKLEDQLCFALYSTSRAITAAYREGLSQLGITYPQYLVLLRLWERKKCTVSDLGAALALDSGTLSPLLKRLESLGLVQKVRAPNDERTVVVSLTQTGKDLESDTAKVRHLVECSTGLSESEINDLRESVQTVRDHVVAHITV